MSSTSYQVAAAVLQLSPVQSIVEQRTGHSAPLGLLTAESVEVPATSRGTVHRDDHRLRPPLGRLPGLARALQSKQHGSQREKRASTTNAADWLISLQMLSIRG